MQRSILFFLITSLTIPYSSLYALDTSMDVSVKDKFFGAQIVDIQVTSSGIRDFDTLAAPLTVNGMNIPLVHLTDSTWHAFVADRDSFLILASTLNLAGKEVSHGGVTFWALGKTGKDMLFPTLPRAINHNSTSSNPMNPDLDLDGDCADVISASDPCVEWPYIALFDLNENDHVSFTYSGRSESVDYRRNTSENVSISLDRESYPLNAEIILRLEDSMWNINPVEEDRVYFTIDGRVFYQGSRALQPVKFDSVMNSLGFAYNQELKIEDPEKIKFLSNVDNTPATALIEIYPNAGIFDNFDNRADMLSNSNNALIEFNYFGRSTAASEEGGDASVSVSKEEKKEEIKKEENKTRDLIPLLRISNEPVLLNADNQTISSQDIYTLKINEKVSIRSMLTNLQDKEEEITYIVLIKDSENVTVSLSWVSEKIIKSINVTQSWIPERAGSYTIEIFVWQSLESPIAFSPAKMIKVKVT